MTNGDQIFKLAQTLFPICRSITGNGVRDTLGILQKEIMNDLRSKGADEN